MVEALDELAARALRVGIVTNKPARFVVPLLSAFGLDQYFDAVVSGDTLHVQKPDPAPLWYAASAIGAGPGRCVMIGDSITDLRAAHNAGMAAVCVTYGYHHGSDIFDARPDVLISSLLELPMVLDEPIAQWELRTGRATGHEAAQLKE